MKKIWLTVLLIPVLVLMLNSGYAQETICVYEFYSPGCPYCAQVSEKFEELEEKYPQLEVHRINVREESKFFLDIQNAYDIPTDKLSTVPKVFIGDYYCIGAGDCLDEFEPEIQKYLDTGLACPDSKENGGEHITLLGITGLALVDAVNPCALAVLILLLTAILLKYPEKKRKALVAGLAFTTSIFIIYIILGLLIILGFKAASSLISSIWVYRALGAFAIVIGILNIKDFFKVGGGGFEIAVPKRWRPKMKQIIRSVTSPKGAFFVGIIVSLFLLPCTAGPYFVAGGLLANVSWFEAFVWLVYYNLLFVVPMIIITLFVYFGLAKANKIQGWRERNINKMHLFAGLILTILGFVILMGWI